MGKVMGKKMLYLFIFLFLSCSSSKSGLLGEPDINITEADLVATYPVSKLDKRYYCYPAVLEGYKGTWGIMVAKSKPVQAIMSWTHEAPTEKEAEGEFKDLSERLTKRFAKLGIEGVTGLSSQKWQYGSVLYVLRLLDNSKIVIDVQ
jgi:hypothetical protein